MKLVLINPDYMIYGDPPLGLAYLASYLRKNADFLDISIFDQLSNDEIIKKIKKQKPDVIGITAVSQNYYLVKELGQKIRKISPESLLVIGGVHITTSPASFKNSPFDIAVIGEGEIPTLKLLKSLNEDRKIDVGKLSKIPGLLMRSKEKIIDTGLAEQVQNLDDIPLPARDLLNMKYYALPRFSSGEDIDPVGSILTSRGCPYSCKFCSSSCFWGRKIRFFSAKRVAEEICLLYKEYGYHRIFIYDDLFSINKPRLKEIVRLLDQAKLTGKIEFCAYGRANCFDDETAFLLKKMGVKQITFGFESGSERVVNYLKGGSLKIIDSIKAIDVAKKHRLDYAGFFMIGSPTETLAEFNETYEFIKKYCANHFILYQTIPFPGTEIWNYALKNKIIRKDFYEKNQKEFVDIDPRLLLSKEVSKKDFIEYFNKIRGIYVKRNKKSILKKILKIKLRHIKSILSISFLKKANSLKGQLLKRIS